MQEKWLTHDNICLMTCYYQSQPGVRGYRQRLHAFWNEKGFLQLGEQSLCDQAGMIQRKGWLSLLQLKEIRILVEKSDNNVEARQEKQNQTGTEPTQQVREWNIEQNDEDERKGQENAKLLINYDNIDSIEKQNILGKTVN